jgi:hypothetical protein
MSHFLIYIDNIFFGLLHNYRDFDPAETVREKMMKIGEVKGVRGLRKLMKEIAITASTGKHDNELVGSAALPLKVGKGKVQLSLCLTKYHVIMTYYVLN